MFGRHKDEQNTLDLSSIGKGDSADQETTDSDFFYFAPHQDDELLCMGIDACTRIGNGSQPHIILCSDGSRSAVRIALSEGRIDQSNTGASYPLTIPEFSDARDREFISSCNALGYRPSHIHFPPRRAIDGSLSVEEGEAIISGYLAFSHHATVCTVSPYVGEPQHADHRRLGQAAVNLYNRGVIEHLILFVEPYFTDSFRNTNPDKELLTSKASQDVMQSVTKAIDSYKLWDPQNGRYAVGYHSVTHEFDDFLADGTAYYHLPARQA